MLVIVIGRYFREMLFKKGLHSVNFLSSNQSHTYEELEIDNYYTFKGGEWFIYRDIWF